MDMKELRRQFKNRDCQNGQKKKANPTTVDLWVTWVWTVNPLIADFFQ